MNHNWNYEGIELWDSDPQKPEPSSIEYLAEALINVPSDRNHVDEDPAFSGGWEELKQSPYYHYKAGCYDDPEVIGDLEKRGLAYASMEMGAIRYLVLAPSEASDKGDERFPMQIFFHSEDYADPYWAMKTLKIYEKYIDAAASKHDRTLIFMITKGEVPHKLTSIILKGVREFHGDREQVLFDLSAYLDSGKKLNDIEGFVYMDKDDQVIEDADSQIELFDGSPVINMAWHWYTPFGAQGIGGGGDGTVDREWQIHSSIGYHKLWTIQFVQKYKTWKNPLVQDFWKKQGLALKIHHVHGERWAMFLPDTEIKEKLPVVVCFYDVCEPNEYSILQAYGEYKAYCDIAAAGDCAVIFFSMESAGYNDWICDILKDAGEKYPVDLCRVYLTGHSRNGHYVQEFVRRNKNVATAIAPLGNSPGLPTPEYSHEAVPVDDKRAALMETMDVPTCILCGCNEVGCLIPVNEAGHSSEAGINVEGFAASAEGKIQMWNRRLKAERCPQQNPEDVMAARTSGDKVERELGFPADRTEILWLEGFEHYIADIRNEEGKYHFRVVGQEGQPHSITYTMNLCAWNFMRRFSRDPKTNGIVELY